MKKVFSYVSALVLLGSTMFGAASCTPQNSSNVEVGQVSLGDSCQLPIAYINVDSLLINYNFAKDLNEDLLKKTEDARMKLNEQGAALEKEFASFQKKVQTNAFLSQERAQQEQDRLLKKRDQLEQLNVKLQQNLAQEQAQMNARLGDTIHTFLKEYNAIKKYEMILSNTMNDNVLIAAPKYDITNEVLGMLNDRYAKNGK